MIPCIHFFRFVLVHDQQMISQALLGLRKLLKKQGNARFGSDCPTWRKTFDIQCTNIFLILLRLNDEQLQYVFLINRPLGKLSRQAICVCVCLSVPLPLALKVMPSPQLKTTHINLFDNCLSPQGLNTTLLPPEFTIYNAI